MQDLLGIHVIQLLELQLKETQKKLFELDPGVSKRGLYKEYAYLHGWKIETTAKETIIKTSWYDVLDEDNGGQ